MSKGQSEAFSRVLIDKALEFSGWDLLDPKQVVFELHSGAGRADYLLKDKLGRTLCVLEAKRENIDPYDAKEQARGYAESLKAPFILLSNGREHWFWNFQRADQRDAYRIERLPSRDDLERVQLKNMQPPRPLGSEIITKKYLEKLRPGFLLHRYQIPAMDEIARQFDTHSKRKFLLEMATGTGKTILCAASTTLNWPNTCTRRSSKRSLALWCDLVIASEDAILGQTGAGGNHADVGGSYPENESRLSDSALD
jgi:type I restriction enzyme R subunit